jgi:hypothetical protein
MPEMIVLIGIVIGRDAERRIFLRQAAHCDTELFLYLPRLRLNSE